MYTVTVKFIGVRPDDNELYEDSVKVFNLTQARIYADMALNECINVFSVDITDSFTGEVIDVKNHSNKEAEEN